MQSLKGFPCSIPKALNDATLRGGIPPDPFNFFLPECNKRGSGHAVFPWNCFESLSVQGGPREAQPQEVQGRHSHRRSKGVTATGVRGRQYDGLITWSSQQGHRRSTWYKVGPPGDLTCQVYTVCSSRTQIWSSWFLPSPGFVRMGGLRQSAWKDSNMSKRNNI